MVKPDGFVLAGGRSRRMGFDKARADYDGQPMAVAVLRSLSRVCGRVALVRRGAEDDPWLWPDGAAVPIVREPADGEPHPLWGVVSALQASQTPVALVVPCDVPGLSDATLSTLHRNAPAVAVDGSGRRHPLVGAFPVGWASRARGLAAAGGSARRFAEDATGIPVDDAELVNINDPAALARAAGLHTRTENDP